MAHELSITVEAPDGNGYISVPTIFPGQLPGLDPSKPQTLTEAHKRRAIERAYALSRMGVKFRAFPSISEAVEAARQVSEAGPAAPTAPSLPGGQLEGADVAVEPRGGSLVDIGDRRAVGTGMGRPGEAFPLRRFHPRLSTPIQEARPSLAGPAGPTGL